MFRVEELGGEAGELAELGGCWMSVPHALHGGSVMEFLAETLLQVRTRDGDLRALRMNAAQRMFEERRGRHNIVLKARQMGMSTWVSARFFLRTITLPGTMTVQVAHTREAAEAIFRDGAEVLGAAAGGDARRRAEAVEAERGADGVSGDGQRVPRGERGGRERGTRDHDPEPALQRGGAVAGGCGGDAGGVAGGADAGGGQAVCGGGGHSGRRRGGGFRSGRGD